MKHIRKLTRFIVVIMLFASVFTFLNFRKSGFREEFGATTAMALSEREDWDDITDFLDTPYEAIANDNMSVYVTEGGGVYVADKDENILWANISLEDSNAFAGDANLLTSPFFVEYNFQREQNNRIYTLEEAVERNQYKVYLDNDRIITEYILGECGDLFLLPQAIPKQRFEEEILPNLDETDSDYILRRYTLYDSTNIPEQNRQEILELCPGIKNTPIYVLTDGDSVRKRERTAEIIETAGYTHEKYEEDRKITLEKQAEFKETFHISIVYYLDGNDLIVQIPCSEIEFFAENPLVAIGFAQYGSYADSEDEGFYFLPVNSGVIDRVGSDYDSSYKVNLMGTDLVQSMGKDLNADCAPLPVFGMVKNNLGYFAIIEEGAEITTLNLDKAKGASTLYPSFRLLEHSNVAIVTNKQSYVYGKKAYQGDITIRYHFLEKDTANYNYMANYYREYLKEKSVLPSEPEDVDFLVEVVGNITARDTIIGLIPIKAVVPLTTFEQCQEIVDYLKNNGVNDFALKLSGFNKHGLFGQTPGKYVFENKLGGKKIREVFFKKMESEGIPLYLDVNLAFYYNNHNFSGYNPRKYNSLYPNSSVAKFTANKVPSGLPLDNASAIHIVSPSKYPEIMKKYDDRLDKVFNLSIGDTTQFLNTDFNMDDYKSRTDTIESLKSALGNLKGRKVLGKNPAGHLLSALSLVEDLEVKNSQTYNFDYEIPFVQMVLHGSLSYASKPINGSSNHQEALLSIIETGSIPKYKLGYELDRKIVKTEYNYLYYISYDEWKETMVSDAEYVDKALNGLERIAIIKHEIHGDLRKVTYENGAVIYVNYGNKDISIDGITVPAESYLRV